MSESTNIPWADSTVNDFIGCSKVSEGCKNCYAEAYDKRQLHGPISHWGKGAPRLKSNSATFTRAALNRKPWVCNECGKAFPVRIAHGCGSDAIQAIELFHPRRIFSLSLGDWLDPEVPIEWFAEMLNSIRLAEQCTHILCTKRAGLFWERFYRVRPFAMDQMCQDTPLSAWVRDWMDGAPPANVWVLASAENQETADERIPKLLNIPAAVRGLSVEPMLGPIDLKMALEGYKPLNCDEARKTATIDWIIVGGESGPKARPCNIEWIRNIVEQCKAANVPCFVKQDSGPKPGTQGKLPNDLFNTKQFPL